MTQGYVVLVVSHSHEHPRLEEKQIKSKNTPLPIHTLSEEM
jgi:hypothetical protein